jgi:hypothetical protein
MCIKKITRPDPPLSRMVSACFGLLCCNVCLSNTLFDHFHSLPLWLCDSVALVLIGCCFVVVVSYFSLLLLLLFVSACSCLIIDRSHHLFVVLLSIAHLCRDSVTVVSVGCCFVLVFACFVATIVMLALLAFLTRVPSPKIVYSLSTSWPTGTCALATSSY